MVFPAARSASRWEYCSCATSFSLDISEREKTGALIGGLGSYLGRCVILTFACGALKPGARPGSDR